VTKRPGGAVQCDLCPRHCVIGEGQAGDCRVRINQGGVLYAVTYARPCAIHMDPVEKKPMFHFLPGTSILSVATAGCNLHCKNCQNWSISQADPETVRVLSWTQGEYGVSPRRLVNLAASRQVPSIAYTYTDPNIFYEYAYDTARLAHASGIKNVTVTAGYIEEKPLRRMARYIDGTNVDIKTMNPTFFRENCGGVLHYVLDGLVVARQEGIWIEVTNLIIPTLNDDPAETKKLCQWVVRNLGPDTPLHLSRFYPHHQLRNLPPTPVETLIRARKIARNAGLHFVYIGNVQGEDFESTFCPACGKKVIGRVGYTITVNHLKDGKCDSCGHPIPGVWK